MKIEIFLPLLFAAGGSGRFFRCHRKTEQEAKNSTFFACTTTIPIFRSECNS